MDEPVLAIMAAGMGSRYGGLKQIDPIDNEGHILMDFSIYDAMRAGFRKVVFIIKRENEADFRERIGSRMERQVRAEYVFQELGDLPEGFQLPEGRVKPWGTGHAVLSALPVIDGPFAVINADDYYGRQAFQLIYDFLDGRQDSEKYQYAMVGYLLKNTLTENGYVARGVCKLDGNGRLRKITERTHIEKRREGPAYTEDGGRTYTSLPGDAAVSMNLWGFTPSILSELKMRFPAFLKEKLEDDPLKCEFFLPSVVDGLIREGKAEVSVLKSQDRWHGVTYQEDKPMVVQAIRKLKEEGLYPERLWEK